MHLVGLLQSPATKVLLILSDFMPILSDIQPVLLDVIEVLSLRRRCPQDNRQKASYEQPHEFSHVSFLPLFSLFGNLFPLTVKGPNGLKWDPGPNQLDERPSRKEIGLCASRE